MNEILKRLYEEINRRRLIASVPTLDIDSNLEQAAQRHSNDMFYNDFCSHIGSDGSNYIQRIKATGSNLTPIGEILIKGPAGRDIQKLVQNWINSEGHKKILLYKNATKFGAGFNLKTEEIKGNYWVVDFSK